MDRAENGSKIFKAQAMNFNAWALKNFAKLLCVYVFWRIAHKSVWIFSDKALRFGQVFNPQRHAIKCVSSLTEYAIQITKKNYLKAITPTHPTYLYNL